MSKASFTNDVDRVVALLRKKQRASAEDLGTTPQLMNFLKGSGITRKDGFMKTGHPGRPPVAWVLNEGVSQDDLPEWDGPARHETRKVISQSAIDAAITEVSHTSHARHCTCIMETGVGTTADEIRAMGVGCTNPHYVCPALDAVRRRADLHNQAKTPFVEVVG